MYKHRLKKYTPTCIKVNQGYPGETIEQKVHRITVNKEPITDGAPLIYSERNEGVLPAYNIRTDRWDVAIEAMDKVDKSYKAKREERHKPKEDNKNDDGKPESTQGTENK